MSPTRRSVNLLLLLLLLGASACGPKPIRPVMKKPDGTVVTPPPAPEPEEEDLALALAKDAEELERKGALTEARAKRDQLLRAHPATLAAARILEARAALQQEEGDLAGALSSYEALLFNRPDYDRAEELRERYGRLLVTAGRYNDAANMLGALFAQGSPAQKARLWSPLGEALLGDARPKEAVEVLAQALASPHVAGAEREQATSSALTAIDTLSLADARSLFEAHRSDPAWAQLMPALGLKLARLSYQDRDYARAEATLEFVITRFATSPLAAEARELLTRLRSRAKVEPRALGVVLPLSGKYEQYGKRSLVAIELAFKAAEGFRLVVRDSKGEAEDAAKAVEDLVLIEHVIAIIGPLFSNEALAAAEKAEALGVPLLTLSHREGLPEIGPHVFRTALTVSSQAKELARVAFEQLGFSRFALLYPRNGYGREFVQVFWDEVNRRKGEIRAAEIYENDQTTFTELIRRMVGRLHVGVRGDFREAMAELRKQKLPPHKLKAEAEKLRKRLAPIIDFDAIVIPDSGHRIGLIAPALAVEDIVTERDEKELEKIRKATGNPDIKPVTLLGASTWNSPQTLSSCERYCEGAVFVDAFFLDSPEPLVRDFVTAFRAAAGAEPYLSEAQAYDTAALLKKMIVGKNPGDRLALRDELAKSSGFEGVTGLLRFDEKGDINKRLFVLTIKGGTINRLESPPAPPQG